jgi:PAS domain-containing protein
LGLALERTRAEELLGQEAERLAVTLESVREGIVVTDPEGRVRLMNRVALGFAGKPWDSARGRLAAHAHAPRPRTGGRRGCRPR